MNLLSTSSVWPLGLIRANLWSGSGGYLVSKRQIVCGTPLKKVTHLPQQVAIAYGPSAPAESEHPIIEVLYLGLLHLYHLNTQEAEFKASLGYTETLPQIPN